MALCISCADLTHTSCSCVSVVTLWVVFGVAGNEFGDAGMMQLAQALSQGALPKLSMLNIKGAVWVALYGGG